MKITYSLQTKRARRIEKGLEALLRVEAQEWDIDHDTLQRLTEMHREAQRVTATYENRDVEAAIEEDLAADAKSDAREGQ